MFKIFAKRSVVPPAPAQLRGEPAIDRAREQIAAAEDHDALIAVLRDTARGIIGSDGITIVRRDGDAVTYVTEDAISPLWAGQSFPIRSCVSGMAMLARTPIVIPDILIDQRVPMNAYLSTFVRSMVVVPIGHEDPRMAIGAYWRAAGPVASIAVDRLILLATATADLIDRIEGLRDPARQAA